MKNKGILLLGFILLVFVPEAGRAALQAMPAHVEVMVTGCQGSPIDGYHVILLGEKEADPLGEGKYDLGDVDIGKHRLYVYGEYGTAFQTALDINETYADIKAEVMIDTCINTSLTTVSGKVTDGQGKPVKGAEVGVDDLFVLTHTDGQGKYVIDLPPGEWELKALYKKLGAMQKASIPEAVEGGEERGKLELNLMLR